MNRMIKLAALLLLFSMHLPGADACVGRILNIGVVNAPEEKVLAEVLSNIINERTGTNVNVRIYGTAQELYEAVARNEIDITIENTSRAIHALNLQPVPATVDKAYEAARAVYEKEKGLVWLRPFGFLHAKTFAGLSHTAPVLRREVFSNFPALPRVVDKLGGLINDEAYEKLVKSVEAGEKPRKSAREFLKSKKLI